MTGTSNYYIRINVGGKRYKDSSGRTWSADREYSSGMWGCLDSAATDVMTSTKKILGTDDQKLFQSCRVGEIFRYRFDVPPGKYSVRLLFAETYWTTSDAEQQEVIVQGKKVLDRFNIFDSAGSNTACEKTVKVEVKEGTLTVECRGLSLPMHSGARICGIEIICINKIRIAADEKKENIPYNVILVSFDTLRRDHLSCYGHRKKLSPVIDSLAQKGVQFEDCVVNSGWTLPQHMSMITGLYPLHHGQIYLHEQTHLPSKYQTLAEIFHTNGYVTMGFCNRNRFGGGWQYGFARGMLHYSTIHPYNNMMELVPDSIASALKAIKGRPFFMYLHSNDTHEPFEASEPFGSKWGLDYINKYEGEVTYVDHYLGRILDHLKKLRVLDRTLVVVTSDHGSEFQEHGFLEKKLNLYEEISRIPLVMCLPKALPPGKRIPGQAQTIDIAPTILDICSIPIPGWMDGRSLVPGIQGKRKRGHDAVMSHTIHEIMDGYEHFAVRTGQYKFIRCAPFKARPEIIKGNTGERFRRLIRVSQIRNGYCHELYDLKSDPSETHNIIGLRPAIARQLEQRLDNWIKSCGYVPRKSGITKLGS